MTRRSVADLMDMSGSTSLVTGASGHIGREICFSLAEAGSNLILLDLASAGLENLQKSLMDEYGVKASIFPCDLESSVAWLGLSTLLKITIDVWTVLSIMPHLLVLPIFQVGPSHSKISLLILGDVHWRSTCLLHLLWCRNATHFSENPTLLRSSTSDLSMDSLVQIFPFTRELR